MNLIVPLLTRLFLTSFVHVVGAFTKSVLYVKYRQGASFHVLALYQSLSKIILKHYYWSF